MIGVDGLYREHHDQLVRVLGHRFPAVTIQTVEDAVQYAWLKVLAKPDGWARDQVFSWLYVVAFREVLRHVQREGAREVCLDQAADTDTRVDVDAMLDARSALAAIAHGVSPRQLRTLTLQAQGASHREISRETGMTMRTVERQILRGRARARIAVAT